MINRGNYIVIQDWMVTDLKLKGNELLVYAIIYGFSQTENQKYTGTLKYLIEWTSSSLSTIQKTLQSLLNKKLIHKDEVYINNVKFCNYFVEEVAQKLQGTTENQQGISEIGRGYRKSVGGTPKIGNHNINNNTSKEEERKKYSKEYFKERKENPTPKTSSTTATKQSFNNIIDNYIQTLLTYSQKDKEEIRGLIQEWLKVRKVKRAAMTDKAIELNLKKLNQTAQDSNMTLKKYLEEVICRGWQAFYAINDNVNKHSNSKPQERVRTPEEEERYQKEHRKLTPEEIAEIERENEEFMRNNPILF